MKYFILCCALLLAFSASAQVPTASVAFGIHGNVTNTNFGGDLKEIYGLGYGGGIHFDLNLGVLSLRLSGDYLALSPDKDKYRTFLQQYLGAAASGITIEGARIDVFSGNLNAKLGLVPLPLVTIYATGGAGLVNLGVTDAKVLINGTPAAQVPGIKGQTKPSANAGAGVDIHLGGLTLYGEVKVNWIMTEGETSTQVPLATIGLTF
jgi:opacity protein-like surface antigen